ncbi:MAG: glucose-6-phosphate isomerase [SAR324 cluster bacterium]|uniref:Glucose-6-phosphate isomerase n=1 Tax=SAR324 cluster bacterium TaxID=2024889 RepID=A0A7X9FNY0_9DELT|nr:glucose-6-phosphate isomerase [SAR324 cluster bacterium]
MNSELGWEKFKELCFYDESYGFLMDLSASGITKKDIAAFESKAPEIFSKMEALEKGALANPDEKRMVGHYWLRNSSLAPSPDLQQAIDFTIARIKDFKTKIHEGSICSPNGEKFKHLLLIGIGGSALGPQFIYQAFRNSSNPMDLYFFDNTDPDGMQRVLSSIPDLKSTLVIVISKSGGTKETRNGQIIAKEAFKKAGLQYNKHFVAVTGEHSELDKTAEKEAWICRFPMWDWVGGRTSETSAVGLLPAALHGLNIDEFLDGARCMDELTRCNDIYKNPAMLLSLAWYHLCKGRGERAMVILPYSDRLELFSRYLQQLVMESLGKEFDLDGNKVDQGITVYGNKGSTDQHAYVQQLRDGLDNFFVTFIEVLKEYSDTATTDQACPTKHLAQQGRSGEVGSPVFVEEGITSGDYLGAFLQGTRAALAEKQRPSLTICLDEVSPFTVGMLIALFERTVGFYASLVNINAYHQPGVEAGKKAAVAVLEMQKKILGLLSTCNKPMSVEEIAEKIGAVGKESTVFNLLRRLTLNNRITCEGVGALFERLYRK